MSFPSAFASYHLTGLPLVLCLCLFVFSSEIPVKTKSTDKTKWAVAAERMQRFMSFSEWQAVFLWKPKPLRPVHCQLGRPGQAQVRFLAGNLVHPGFTSLAFFFFLNSHFLLLLHPVCWGLVPVYMLGLESVHSLTISICGHNCLLSPKCVISLLFFFFFLSEGHTGISGLIV